MRRFLILSIILLIHGKAWAGIEVENGAPLGFEAMAGPRQVMVNLNHGGNFIGTFSAKAIPGHLQFDDPDAVIAEIPGLVPDEEIQTILAQPMPSNPQFLCGMYNRDVCGHLEPKVVGLIYDEKSQSAEVFIHPARLSLNDMGEDTYLPLPERKFSSVLGLNGAINGADSQAPTYAVSNDSIYAYGEMKLTTRSTITNRGLRFDTAAASIERNGWTGVTGLFQSRPMRMVSSRDVAGIGFSTSMRTRKDRFKTQGSDLILFLPRRSIVALSVDGRLYSSRSYEAGNQSIDTGDLPDGAYTVTLQITEADGNTREEKRFFAKIQDIPPPGKPIYYAEAGVIRKPLDEDGTVPELTNLPILRTGTIRRVADNIGIELGVLGTKGRATAEAGAFWLLSNTQIQATSLASSAGDIGAQMSAVYSNDRISLSADARRLWSSGEVMDEYDDMSEDSTQVSSAMSYSASPEVSLGVRANYTEQAETPTTFSAGPYAEWRMWQRGESILTFSADAARTDGANEGTAMLRLSHRIGKYGVTSEAGVNGSGAMASGRGWYDDQTPARKILASAGLSRNGKDSTVSSDVDYSNRFGQVQGSLQKNFGNDNDSVSYGGSFAVNAAQSGSSIHLGGDENERSAVVIKVDGDTEVQMRIFVNDSERSLVDVGDTQVLYLAPFQTYAIRLTPKDAGLYDYDSGERRVTLYPGNVADLEWSVNNFYVVSAHIVDEAGADLSLALLLDDKDQGMTDQKGRIQMERKNAPFIDFKKQDGSSCRVDLPRQKAINGVVLYESPLMCRAITQSVS